MPRCLELISKVGTHEILREQRIFAAGFWTAKERAAVDAWLVDFWQALLQSPSTLPDARQ